MKLNRWVPPSMRALAVAIGLFASLASPEPAEALENMTTHYWRGSLDFFSGYLPKKPGVSFKSKYVHYRGKADENVVNQNIDIGAKLDLDAWVNSFGVVTPWKILGANYGFGAGFTYSWIGTDAAYRIQPEETVVGRQHGYAQGFTDPSIVPVVLGWHAGNWNWTGAVDIYLPAGRYENERIPNNGKKFWSVAPVGGITYFDSTTGWHASASVVYTFPFSNEEANYKSGQAVELDYSVGRMLSRNLNIGLAGYMLQQTTPDRGSDDLFGNFRAQVVGLGPAVSYDFNLMGQHFRAKAKWYGEFAAKDTFRGNQVNLSLAAMF